MKVSTVALGLAALVAPQPGGHAQYITAQPSCSVAAGIVRRLRVAVLPAEKQNLDLAEVATDLENLLNDRWLTLTEAENQANSNAETIAAVLLDELAKIRAAGSAGGGGSSGGVGASEPSEDTIAAALQGTTSQPFRQIATALAALDLTSEDGQRDGLAAGFGGNCLLATRVLLSTAPKGEPLAARHDVLGQLHDLREYRRSYLNYMYQVDTATGVIPARMLKYEFSSTGNTTLFESLMKLQIGGTDWIAAPNGVMGWHQHQDGKRLPIVHDPRDYYCQPSLITDLCNFLHIGFTSIGLADESTEGYTIVTAGEFYAAHLNKAKRLETQVEVFNWLQRASTQWQAAMALISERLKGLVTSHRLDRPFFTYVLAFTNEAFNPLKRAEELMDRIADSRAEQQSLTGMPTTAGQSANTYILSLLSQKKLPAPKPLGKSKQTPQLTPQGKRKRPEQPGEGWSNPPGSLLSTFKWLNQNNTLIISGLAWHVPRTAAKLGVRVKGPCWPYLLFAGQDKNRPARCSEWGSGSHGDASSPAHVLPKGPIDFATMSYDGQPLTGCYRDATAQEKQGINKPPPQPQQTQRGPQPQQTQRGRGKGDGRGSNQRRGRGGYSAEAQEEDAAYPYFQ